MKIVIAGSRTYCDYEQAARFIEESLKNISSKDVTILSGGCCGADALGERYATEHDIPIQRYLPNWRLYGKGAGPKRNREMVEACDAVICFWDGISRGTKSLLEYARRMGKTIFWKEVSVCSL